MSTLERQQASFHSSMAAASRMRVGTSAIPLASNLGPGAGVKRALAPPSPSPSVGSTTSAAVRGGSATPSRRDRGDGGTPIVYSQPAHTSTGENRLTQLTYVIKWLREKGETQTYDAISGFLSMGNNRSEDEHEKFVDAMRRSMSIEWIPDPELSEQTWRSGTYRHRAAIPNVKTKDQLIGFLQAKTDASGVSVKDLKDGWPDCEKAINELEGEHRLLAVRQKKDGAPRIIWLDDPSLFHTVDPEFKTLWAKCEIPAVDSIVQRLQQVGQKAASEDPRLKLANMPKQEKKKKRAMRRSTKMTNAHMEEKFKDFSHFKR